MTVQLEPTTNLYDQDYQAWLLNTIEQLQARNFDNVDWENLLEELDSLAGSDRRELKNRLIVLLMHLLKYQYQPGMRSNSWINTIWSQFYQITSLLEDSPSLKSYYEEIFGDCYLKAIPAASSETKLPKSFFPVESPFSSSDVIDSDFIFSLVNPEED